MVCGSRTWDDPLAVDRAVADLATEFPEMTLVEGGARGADRMARGAARRLDVPVETHEADWQRYGRSAGPKRNKEMLELGADLVVAFLDARRDREGTRGTRDMVERAERAGVPVRLVTMT